MKQTNLAFDHKLLAPETILELVERMLASRHFRQTRTLDKFFRHTVTQTLAGEESQLKESLIGREVFHRGENFNPALDAVVRVQAGVLRKKLASYYADEGQAEEIIIELPKGCYVPTFRQRSEVVASEACSLPLGSSFDHAEPALPETLKPVLAEQAKKSRWWQAARGQIAAAFAFGVILTVASMHWFNLGRANQWPPAPAGVAAQAQPLLWEKFFEPGATTLLAYGTPQFFQFKGLYLRDVLVNSPQEVEQSAGLRLASVRKVLNASLDPIEIYTGVGEAHGLHTLSRFFWQNGNEIQIARSRLVGWQEVKNANLIFLSSMRFHTLAEQLDYPNDFVIKTSGVSGAIMNLHPAAGEQAEYGVQGGESYAVLTLWPGKAENRRILQLSGNTTWGTLAAAEYATDKESLRQLHEQLEECRQQRGLERHPPYFQVLVRAEVKDAQPIALAYVTHHDLEVSGPAATAARLALK